MVMARPSIAKTEFAQRLTAVREALGFRERKPFASKLDMHPDTLGGYERGDTMPDFSFLTRYKREFSVNLDWLITGEGTMFTSAAELVRQASFEGTGDRMGSERPSLTALEHVRAAEHRATHSVDLVRLEAAIEAVEEGLHGRRVAPKIKAELTIAAYDLLTDSSAEVRARVIRLVKG